MESGLTHSLHLNTNNYSFPFALLCLSLCSLQLKLAILYRITLTANQKNKNGKGLGTRQYIPLSFRVLLYQISAIQKCLPIAAWEPHLKGTFLLLLGLPTICCAVWVHMCHLSLLSGRWPWGEEMSPEVGSPHLCKMKDNPCQGWLPQLFQRLQFYLLEIIYHSHSSFVKQVTNSEWGTSNDAS